MVDYLERVEYPTCRSARLFIGSRTEKARDDVLAGFPILIESAFREGGKQDRRLRVTTRQEVAHAKYDHDRRLP
jgi:hypothetical protein